MMRSWLFRARYGGAERRGMLFVSGTEHGYRARFVVGGKSVVDSGYEAVVFVDGDGQDVDLPEPESIVSRDLGKATRLVLKMAVGFDAFELLRRLPCTGDVSRSAEVSVPVGPRIR